jgi:hypothetical protein
MSIRETITRRGFLAAGVAAGAVGLASGSSRVVAISSSRIEVIERWVKSGVIGKLVYFQFHLTEGFDLETAVMMVEALTRDLRLEKVSALGDWEFSGAPGVRLITNLIDADANGIDFGMPVSPAFELVERTDPRLMFRLA